MIFFAITRKGFDSFMAIGDSSNALWVCAGVLSDQELELLWSKDMDVSVFKYSVEPNEFEAIADAVNTIKEHHPGKTIWVEQ